MNWIRLMTKNPSELKPTSDTLYQAAQYIPMVARTFIEKVKLPINMSITILANLVITILINILFNF